MGEDRVGPRTIVMMIVLFARYRGHFFSRILFKKKKVILEAKELDVVIFLIFSISLVIVRLIKASLI